MIWNEHSELRGKHATFAPSNPSFLNYGLEPENEDIIFQRFAAQYSSQIGTITHDFAEERIFYNQKLHKTNKSDLLIRLLKAGIPPIVINMDYIYSNLIPYVNDAISFRMDPEVILKYSDDCFGTSDAICYRDKELRIHDLKTGRSTVHMDQLLTYAALFFLEYKASPENTTTILRIYQASDILEDQPESERIRAAMNQIVELDKKVKKWKAEDKVR